jgi:hypothetical protein
VGVGEAQSLAREAIQVGCGNAALRVERRNITITLVVAEDVNDIGPRGRTGFSGVQRRQRSQQQGDERLEEIHF